MMTMDEIRINAVLGLSKRQRELVLENKRLQKKLFDENKRIEKYASYIGYTIAYILVTVCVVM